jgi:hypothetical protein
MRLIICVITFMFSSLSQAADHSGFYFGSGYVYTTNNECSSCDAQGKAFEIGYDINHIFSIDAKKLDTTYDNSEDDLSMEYIGINVGDNFNTETCRLYAKLGYAESTFSGFTNETDSGIAFGAGARLSIPGGQKGLQLKAEVLKTEFLESYNTVVYAGVSYKF